MIGLEESDGGTKKQVSDNLGKVSGQLNAELSERLEKIWNDIYNDAIANCPVDTGSLVGTIKLDVDAGNLQASGAGIDIMSTGMSENIFNGTITAGDDAVVNPINKIPTSWYAIWVHDGHYTVDGVWVPEQPFLENALAAHEAELEQAMDEALKNIGAE